MKSCQNAAILGCDNQDEFSMIIICGLTQTLCELKKTLPNLVNYEKTIFDENSEKCNIRPLISKKVLNTRFILQATLFFNSASVLD